MDHRGVNWAARRYLDKDMSRFHVPGHKGTLDPHDLTEIDGLDSLYHASGPIRETERAYSELYGTAESLLCSGGSTLCIQAMLATVLNPGDHLLIGRGAHVSAVNAMALLDLHPIWLLPATDPVTGLAEAVTAAQVEEALAARPNIEIKAVYLTSPSYFGIISDIAAISRVCRSHGIPLLVDNAHGAHLAFCEPGLHPIALGADLCADSLHKTLPVLTPGAMLHIGSAEYIRGHSTCARKWMALFGSTSPSYPVMLSADRALDYLRGGIKADIARVSARVASLAELARGRGFLLPAGPLLDPLRLTLGAAPLGRTGPQLAQHLRASHIEPELAGGQFCVLMATGFNADKDFARLEQAIRSLPAGAPLPCEPIELALPKQAMPLRQAAFAASERVPAERAVGRIAGALVAPCPPGTALVVPGELVDSATARLLKSCGILQLDVVK